MIRTGGPSAPGEAKVAIVASDRQLARRRWTVSGSSGVVLHGRLRRTRGLRAPWRHAYRIDLSAITTPGSYRVRVVGRRSRPWIVTPAGSGDLIGLALGFFRANRDGAEPSPLHGPSHLNDAVVEGGPLAGRHIDLTGGWMDAGDQLHFAQTTAYAAAVLQAAARIDPAHATELNAEADVGVRWLVKAHPEQNLFVTQVGDERDHNRGFSDPAGDDASAAPGIGTRFAYHWGNTVGGDVAGKAAAALAMAAQRASVPDRGALMRQAEDWYEAGRASGVATPALAGAGGFYVVKSWKGSMAAGAAELYRATGQDSYRQDAISYLAGSDPGNLLGYSDFTGFAAADMCGAFGGFPSLEVQQQGCEGLREGAATARSEARSNAFARAGYLDWGSTAENAAGGAEAALAQWAGVFAPGDAIAAGARDWMLGRNPWGASFIAGFGPRSPRRIHSWASVFGDGLPSGAVVGGPAPVATIKGQGFHPGGPLARFNSRSVAYQDRRADYVTSEPALDYTANTILLLAALDATASG